VLPQIPKSDASLL